MKKRLFLGTVAAAAVCLFAGPGLAHHSAAQFDFGQSVEVEGIVKVIEVNNPHTLLIMEVTDEAGTRDIEFEGHSRNNVYRRGWRPDMINVGDHLIITIAPMRNGADGGYIQGMTTDDGHSF